MKFSGGIEVPSSWALVPLKRITRLGYGEALAGNDRVGGQVKVYGSNGPFDSHSAANTLAPCIIVGRKGSYGKVQFSEAPVFAVDTTFVVDRRHTAADLRFLYYVLGVLGLDELSDDTAVPGLSRAKAYQSLAPLPPLKTQQRIALFLDEKTVRIDKLIDGKRLLLERLAEKRQTLITRAVTKGLNRASPVKSSGIDWLGDIPAHWDVLPLKRLLVEAAGIQMGPFGGMLINLPDYETGYKLYGQENTISGDFSLGRRWVEEERYHQLRRYELLEGDLVITRKGSLGNCRRVPRGILPGIADSDTIRLRPDPTRLKPEWALVLLHEAQFVSEQIAAARRGAILSGLNTTVVGSLLFTVPPVDEQAHLIDRIENAIDPIQHVIKLIEDSIAKLQEQRAALITAAVTGQIGELQ